MDSSRFDELVQTWGCSTRRSVFRLMAGTAAGALVLGQLGIDDASAACVAPGKKCKCTNGGATCGKTCCAPGQICQDAASATCVNGSLQPGATCDPDQPLGCASGECECFTLEDLTSCTCRQEGCFGQGIECMNTSQCCQGFCSEFENPPVCVTLD